MLVIPYVSIVHRLAKRLKLAYTGMIFTEPEDFYYQDDFRLYPKHLQGMERDNSIVECIPDSSKIDNIIGDDSLILSAIKNDVNERCIEITRTWKSIVTHIFGTQHDSSPEHESALLLQGGNEVLQEKVEKRKIKDHDVLQEKIEAAVNGGDVKTPSPSQ